MITFIRFTLSSLLFLSSTLYALTLDEKIGSLFIVDAYADRENALLENQTEQPTEYVESMIRDYHVGGILYKRAWDPLSLKSAAAHFQSLSSQPLFMMQDQEWGLQMRHAQALRFPKQITLGAIQEDALLVECGRELARQARLTGMHSTLSPVADVNSNPDNPIIGDRSFGDDPERVAHAACLLMQGLQEGGVVAVAKHFPGHGDTLTDSHTHLPTVMRTKEELQKIDLLPFQAMIKKGVPAILSAHIMLPALDQTLPGTLSPTIMTDLLQKEMGFKGVIITDDLTMKAIEDRYPPEKAALMSFQAGCDLMLSTKNIGACIQAIKQAVIEGQITEEELTRRVDKVSALKTWIATQKPLQDSDLFSEKARLLKRTLYRSAITFLNPKFPDKSACILQIGGSHTSVFAKEMQLPVIYLPSDPSALEQTQTLQKLATYKSVIFSFQDITQERFRKKVGFWGIQESALKFLDLVRTNGICPIYVLFGSPYTATLFHRDESVLVAYENDPDCEKAAAEVLQGTLTAKGKLPIRLETP